MIIFESLLFIIAAYFFGSISSAIIVCKLMRLPDPRTEGSKNPGATNVLRIGGKGPALITLLGDVLKGVIPVLLAKWMGLDPIGLAGVTFAAFLGHLYPVFFEFCGGKGVATLLGCLLALFYPIAIAWMLTWIFIALIFRYVSLASILSSLFAPIYIWYFTHHLIYAFTFLLMGLLVTYRHRQNISNLIHGKERKIGKKK